MLYISTAVQMSPLHARACAPNASSALRARTLRQAQPTGVTSPQRDALLGGGQDICGHAEAAHDGVAVQQRVAVRAQLEDAQLRARQPSQRNGAAWRRGRVSAAAAARGAHARTRWAA
jgi:hypothetical protein